jgi:hypothetical protein
MVIKKKVWPEYFQMILNGSKNVDLRLADFDIKQGDTLILEEYEPETQTYTGRRIVKKAKSIIKLNPTRMHDLQEIKKHGFYVIELGVAENEEVRGNKNECEMEDDEIEGEAEDGD